MCIAEDIEERKIKRRIKTNIVVYKVISAESGSL
jgi:hypothetical protein